MQPWRVLASRSLVERPPWLSVWEEDVELPAGQVIRGYMRTSARDYAVIFALLADGTVPLVHQYKHGTGRTSLDLPAGYLDGPEETPLAAAQRELHEETGVVSDHWHLLGHLVIDTNRGKDCAHVFLALDARCDGSAHLDPTEALEVSYHSPAELRELVHRGEIDTLASVAGIMLAIDRIARIRPN